MPVADYDSTARQAWLIAILAMVATIAVVDRTILSLLFDPIRNDLALSDTQMSLIFGLAFAIANVCFTLPAGYLADLVSRRALILSGALIWSAMTSLCGMAAGFWPLLLARAGVGSAEAVIHPCAYSMLRAALPKERWGRGFALYGMSIMGGSALGFLVGGLLIGSLGQAGFAEALPFGVTSPWRRAMVLLGVVGVPLALLILTVREPLRMARGENASIAAALSHFRSRWTLYLPLVVFSATLAMQSNAYGAFIASVPQRLWKVPVAEVGARLGLTMLFAAPLGNWVIGTQMDRLAARHGVRGLAMVGVAVALIMCVLTTATPAAAGPRGYFILVGGVFMFGGAGFAITAAILAALTPAPILGKISALQLFVYGVVGMGSGPAIVGFVSDRYFAGDPGGIAAALSRCCLCFTAASLVAMLVLLLNSRRRA